MPLSRHTPACCFFITVIGSPNPTYSIPVAHRLWICSQINRAWNLFPFFSAPCRASLLYGTETHGLLACSISQCYHPGAYPHRNPHRYRRKAGQHRNQTLNECTDRIRVHGLTSRHVSHFRKGNPSGRSAFPVSHGRMYAKANFITGVLFRPSAGNSGQSTETGVFFHEHQS